jgi:single-strand DNA-binding protein
MATRGFNKVILMGNLARDPEMRYTVDKRAWARFTVAVGYSWKNKNGEVQEGADFVPVVVWGPRAEFCGRYLKKGSGVLVEGRIKVRSYEAKDGSGKKYSTDVEADNVQFAGSKRDSGGEDFGGPSGETKPSQPDFGSDADFGKSMREKGFGESDFLTDFAALEEGGEEGGPEADIPF